MTNTQSNIALQQKQTAFQWASPTAGVIFPAMAAMLTELAKFSTYYTQLQNDYLNFQKEASQSASKATTSAFEHEASGMKSQAISGFVSAGITGFSGLAMGGLDAGTLYKTSNAETQLENLNAFENEMKNPTGQVNHVLSSGDEETIGLANVEQQRLRDTAETYKNPEAYQTRAVKNGQGVYTVPESDADDFAVLDDHQERLEVIKEQKKKVNNSIQEAYNRRTQNFQYIGIAKDLGNGISNSTGTYYQQEQKSEQGKEEAEKILAQTNEQILQQAGSKESSQFSSNSEQMTQVTQQIGQAAQTADRFNG